MKALITMILIAFLITAMFAQPVKAEGLLSDLFNMIKKWFKSSPLGDIFSMPVKRTENIKLLFYPEKFSVPVNNFVNVTSNVTSISNFKGEINAFINDGYVLLKTDGPMEIKQVLGEIHIKNLEIPSLTLQNTKLVLISGNWNETTESGSLTLKDFKGDCLINNDHVELNGLASKIEKR